MVLNEAPTIQSLLVADEVKKVNGLLQVRNGGWRIHHRVFPQDYVPLPDSPPPQIPLGIAVIVAFRWSQVSQPYKLIVEMCDEDGKRIANHTFQVTEGEDTSDISPGGMHYRTFYIQMGFPFPHPGEYEIIAHIEGIEDSERRWIFEIRDVIC